MKPAMTVTTHLTRREWRTLKKLYKKAFPRCERKPFFVIRSMQKKGKTDVYYFADREGFSGFATTINSPSLVLIDYLAVAPARRSQGCGSEILKTLLETYQDRGVFLEIETPVINASRYETKQRRKDFYLRAGFVPANTRVSFFGVDMELLGVNCAPDYNTYHRFYQENYPFAAKHIQKL